MKKTMFITSVVMVIVMAIALTTSSLAWFTAGGQDSVTTTAFKVTATSGTSTGIAISKDRSQWASNIVLTSTGFAYTGTTQAHGNTGLNPLVPNGNAAAPSYNELLAALAGDSVTVGSTTTFHPAMMIGAKIDSNLKFTDDLYTDGYYVDEFYIRNEASGLSAESIVLSVSQINFTFDKVVHNTTTDQDEFVDTEYTIGNRGTDRYALDATLCVAVLAKVGEFTDTDSSDDGWEIIGYADSKGNSNVRVGMVDAFDEGDTAASSFVEMPIEVTTGDNQYTLNKNSSEEIRPAREDSGVTLPADIKTIKVVAWYDGANLNNNNSSQANLKFNLQFSKVTYVAAP